MLDLEGRTVVITGGATGIGFGLAKACGALGAHIVIGEPRQARLDKACEALAQLGISARAFALDVTDADQMPRRRLPRLAKWHWSSITPGLASRGDLWSIRLLTTCNASWLSTLRGCGGAARYSVGA